MKSVGAVPTIMLPQAGLPAEQPAGDGVAVAAGVGVNVAVGVGVNVAVAVGVGEQGNSWGQGVATG